VDSIRRGFQRQLQPCEEFRCERQWKDSCQLAIENNLQLNSQISFPGEIYGTHVSCSFPRNTQSWCSHTHSGQTPWSRTLLCSGRGWSSKGWLEGDQRPRLAPATWRWHSCLTQPAFRGRAGRARELGGSEHPSAPADTGTDQSPGAGPRLRQQRAPSQGRGAWHPPHCTFQKPQQNIA